MRLIIQASGILIDVTAGPTRWSDLVSEMHALVWEESPLHEVTSQVVDHLGDDRKVVHGPWSTAECQAILIPWLTAGWIDLIADADPLPAWNLTPVGWRSRATRSEAFLILSAQDAGDLLRDPTRWTVGTADGHAMLSRTEEGDRHEFREWRQLAERARDRS